MYWYEPARLRAVLGRHPLRRRERVSTDNRTFVNSGGGCGACTDYDRRFWASYRRRAERTGWDPDEPPDFSSPTAPSTRTCAASWRGAFTPKAMRGPRGPPGRARPHASSTSSSPSSAPSGRGRPGRGPRRGAAPRHHLRAHGRARVGLVGHPPLDQTLLFPDQEHEPTCLPGEDRRPCAAGCSGHEFTPGPRRAGRTAARRRCHRRRPRSSVLVRRHLARPPARPPAAPRLSSYLLDRRPATRPPATPSPAASIALIDHPDQLARLRPPTPRHCSTPRWRRSSAGRHRSSSSPAPPPRDVELPARTIRAGRHVGIWYPSANRDEREFPDPYRFDVTRDPNHHLAFGHGRPLLPGRQPRPRRAPGLLPRRRPGAGGPAARRAVVAHRPPPRRPHQAPDGDAAVVTA